MEESYFIKSACNLRLNKPNKILIRDNLHATCFVIICTQHILFFCAIWQAKSTYMLGAIFPVLFYFHKHCMTLFVVFVFSVSHNMLINLPSFEVLAMFYSSQIIYIHVHYSFPFYQNINYYIYNKNKHDMYDIHDK